MRDVATPHQRTRFGQALRSARANGHLTQAEIAFNLEITQTTFSNWERGGIEPKPEQVFVLERLLNVEPGGLSQYLGYVPFNSDNAPQPAAVEPRFPRIIPDAVVRGPGGTSIGLELKNSSEPVQDAALGGVVDRLAHLEQALQDLVEVMNKSAQQQGAQASRQPVPGKESGTRRRQGSAKKKPPGS